MAKNVDDGYELAEILYRVAFEEGLTKLTPEQIQQKYIQLKKGLPAEDEFAAMCLWSGRCSLVHRLDKVLGSRDSKYRVPDLLCVLEYRGKPLPVLVEVKASTKERQKFTKAYCDSLRRYADVVGLPLLMAYKFAKFERPFWFLFDFEVARTQRGTCIIDVHEVIKNDLTGVLLGNFHVSIPKGTSISMTIQKETVHSEVSFVGRVSDIHWETTDGQRVEDVGPLHWLFMLTEDYVETENFPDRLVQRFIKRNDDAVYAHWVLSATVSLGGFNVDGSLNWGKVVKELPFAYSLSELQTAARKGIDQGLVNLLVNQVPVQLPSFLS